MEKMKRGREKVRRGSEFKALSSRGQAKSILFPQPFITVTVSKGSGGHISMTTNNPSPPKGKGYWRGSLLACRLRRTAKAHTFLLFRSCAYVQSSVGSRRNVGNQTRSFLNRQLPFMFLFTLVASIVQVFQCVCVCVWAACSLWY